MSNIKPYKIKSVSVVAGDVKYINSIVSLDENGVNAIDKKNGKEIFNLEWKNIKSVDTKANSNTIAVMNGIAFLLLFLSLLIIGLIIWMFVSFIIYKLMKNSWGSIVIEGSNSEKFTITREGFNGYGIYGRDVKKIDNIAEEYLK